MANNYLVNQLTTISPCSNNIWYNVDMSQWESKISYKIDSNFKINISLFI